MASDWLCDLGETPSLFCLVKICKIQSAGMCCSFLGCLLHSWEQMLGLRQPGTPRAASSLLCQILVAITLCSLRIMAQHSGMCPLLLFDSGPSSVSEQQLFDRGPTPLQQNLTLSCYLCKGAIPNWPSLWASKWMCIVLGEAR